MEETQRLVAENQAAIDQAMKAAVATQKEIISAQAAINAGNNKTLDAQNDLAEKQSATLALQKEALAAQRQMLRDQKSVVEKQKAEYQKRRDALCGNLRKIGWNVPDSKGTMFVWSPLPEGYTNSVEFCNLLMEKTGVICTPGAAFGENGEGFVRFALVKEPAELEKIVDIIAKSGIIK
jgi:aspartate/methionine/tyrosine aminotransferase